MLSRLSFAGLSDMPSRVFACSFALFMLSQFVIERDKTWDFFFYLAVIPAFAVFAFTQRTRLASLCHLRSAQLIAALLGWLCASLIWQDGINMNGAFQYLRRTLITAFFIVASLSFFWRMNTDMLRLFWQALIVLAVLTAIISLSLFLGGWQSPAVRLEAIGQLEQPILGAAVYGLVGLVTLYQAIQSQGRARAAFIVAVAIIATLIFFTYSRGGLASFTLSALLLLFLNFGRRLKLILLAMLALVTSATVILILIPTWGEALLSLPECEMLMRDSHRFAIWQEAIARIAERPLFGWGAASHFSAALDGVTAAHMHNLLLGTLYRGGLLAGALLIALIGTIALLIYRAPPSAERNFSFALLLYALLSVMSDNPSIVDSPAPFWSLFWLPLCYCIIRNQTTQTEVL